MAPGVGVLETVFEDAIKRARREDPFAFITAASTPPFTREEEGRLFILWKEHGDLRARERLARANLRWMVKVANDYSKRATIDINDLISEGGEAMAKAMNKFDCRRGLRFTTYLNWWIQRYMQDHLALANTPLSGHRSWRTHMHFRLRREAPRIAESDNPKVEIQKLAIELHVSEELLTIAIDLELGGTASLDKTLGHPGERPQTLHDTMACPCMDPEEKTADQERLDYVAECVRRALEALPEREREIVEQRLLADGDEQTLEQIGTRYGLTRERIRQIETRAVKMLRELLSEFRIEGIPLPKRLLVPRRGSTRKKPVTAAPAAVESVVAPVVKKKPNMRRRHGIGGDNRLSASG
jgi:RNA polymerase sigma factor (sigma-70 family)